MAIPSNPARSRIAEEFGADTLNSITQVRSLKQMYLHIRTHASTSLDATYSRDDCAGFGRPVINAFTASTGSAGALVDFTVGLASKNNMNDAFATIQYSTDVNNPDPATINDWVTLTAGANLPTIGTNNIDGVELPNPNTEYIFRLLYFNQFNSVSEADHDFYTTYPTATSSDLVTLDTPTLIDVTDNGAGEYLLEWNTTGEPPTTFLFRFQLNGGAFNSDNTFEATGRVNWGSGTNPKEGIAQLASIPDPSDTVGFGVKGQKSGYNDSNYSNTITLEPATPAPTVTTLSADQITTSSVRFRGSLGNVTGEGYTCVYRWQYKVQGTGTWNNTPTSTTTSDGTKTRSQSGLSSNTTYEFRMQAWNQSDSGNVITGSTLTVTTAQPNTNPTNVDWTDNGSNSQVTWTTPESGNPGSYTINISVNGGANQNLVSGLSGSSTSYTFDICNYASNGDNAVVTVIAVSPSGSGSSPSRTVTSFCF